eukprot:608503-Alexandrium_andersonii.AAC.1
MSCSEPQLLYPVVSGWSPAAMGGGGGRNVQQLNVQCCAERFSKLPGAARVGARVGQHYRA